MSTVGLGIQFNAELLKREIQRCDNPAQLRQMALTLLEAKTVQYQEFMKLMLLREPVTPEHVEAAMQESETRVKESLRD